MRRPTTRKAPRAARKGKIAATELILAALRGVSRPLGAYELQARLSDVRHLAPPTVYRALDRLIDGGLVHRIESLNAFVACRHEGGHDNSAFAICDQCGSVTEICDPDIQIVVDTCSQQSGFDVTGAAIELRGSCRRCAVLRGGSE